jgi:RNA polymerase sigma-70 factor (ECF subfamily)
MDGDELRRQLDGVHPDCFGWALACCNRDREEAEDVLQMTYLAVLDGRARHDGRSSFRTWLFGVIRRVAAGERRKAWARRLLLMRNGHRLAPERPAAQDLAVEQDETSRVLERALDGLSTRQRAVLHLVFYQDLTVEEAAGVLGVSVGSARTHYARGKQRLAALLAPEDAR